MRKVLYWWRTIVAYVLRRESQLDFWHERPAVTRGFDPKRLGPYYMTFRDKADYRGPKDATGVILLNYRGEIGKQYNPLAIAQYGLAHYNLYLENGGIQHLAMARIQADWLCENLKENEWGVFVWKHYFRWNYKAVLEPGWFSAHAQGTGISLLARMYEATRDERYLEAAKKAFVALDTLISRGGVKWVSPDNEENVWLEEYIVDPPTHILNGFIWGLWGVWDYYLLTKNHQAYELWIYCKRTLEAHVRDYDIGFWSVYDLSEQGMRAIASRFYHELHIVQLWIMHELTNESVFAQYAERWSLYRDSWWNRVRAFLRKVVFKVFYW